MNSLSQKQLRRIEFNEFFSYSFVDKDSEYKITTFIPNNSFTKQTLYLGISDTSAQVNNVKVEVRFFLGDVLVSVDESINNFAAGQQYPETFPTVSKWSWSIDNLGFGFNAVSPGVRLWRARSEVVILLPNVYNISADKLEIILRPSPSNVVGFPRTMWTVLNLICEK